ncbi:hypothetical protein BHE74_00020401 [Ensete ventricosum]|nr:hypothetical protein BHE74_00020401 [Ensete ventricosum]RZS24010.1 hypothetical protein BHM03_00057028 [Ensete ventricosum]
MPKRPSPKPLLPLVSPLPRLRHLAALSGCLARVRLFRPAGHMAGDLATERTTFVAKIRRVRWASFLLGSWNIGVVLLGCFLMVYLLSGCSAVEKLPFAASTMIAGIRVVAMVGAGKAQQETAEIIVSCPTDSATIDAVVRNDRRVFRFPSLVFYLGVSWMVVERVSLETQKDRFYFLFLNFFELVLSSRLAFLVLLRS